MKQESKQLFMDSIRDFRLPRFSEIPNVGLYLEQASKYISEYLSPLGEFTLTPSMISNYVKKGLIANPVRKQYSREQIAYLFFISLNKSILSLDALADFFAIQKRTHSVQRAYDRFCGEFENVLRFTFEIDDVMDSQEEETTLEKRLLYTSVVASVQKIYLERNLEWLSQEQLAEAEKETEESGGA